MKLLHTSEFRTTSDSNAKVDTVERYTFPDGQPYREIAVKVDADMTVDEARRLIADLQHAVALAEEFDQEWLDNAYATLAARNDSEGVSA